MERSNLITGRRLPINELTLVPYNFAGIAIELQKPSACLPTEETIEGTSSSLGLQRVSRTDDNSSASAIPKYPAKHYKSSGLNRRRRRFPTKITTSQPDTLAKDGIASMPGDGFTASEKKIIHHRSADVRLRRRRKPIMWASATLQLQTGPLPEVKFAAHDEELQLEPCWDKCHERPLASRCTQTKDDEPVTVHIGKTLQKNVEICMNVSSDEVRAQLSTISAPQRTYSISSDDSNEEEFVVTDDEGSGTSTDEEEDNETHTNANYSASRHHQEEIARAGRWSRDFLPTQMQSDSRSQPLVSSIRERRNIVLQKKSAPNDGVTLRFRSSVNTCALPPKTFNSKRRLIEVDEAIQDRPSFSARYPSQLIQSKRNDKCGSDDEIAPVGGYTTNSSVHVDHEEPHYHQHYPLRRRLNRSPEIKVFNTDRNMPHTSPKRPRDQNEQTRSDIVHEPSVVRQKPHRYTLPDAPPKDLRTLTRNVSMSNGTLSQAFCSRRRPSLPFRSPLKVRVI